MQMNSTEFIKKLDQVQELMQQENYKEAIVLIERLKELEKMGNFDYNLTHRLYQLDSNSRSLYNQQIILTTINELTSRAEYFSFHELNQILKEKDKLDLSDDLLKREIEILILRNLLPCRIDKEKIIFGSK